MATNPQTLKSQNVNTWDLSNYLPETLQTSFIDILSDYTTHLHKLFYSSSEENEKPENPNNNLPPPLSHDNDKKQKAGARKNILRAHLTPRLFHLVHDAQNSMSALQDSDTLLSPSLHFIQYVSKILSLDSSISQDVCKLQKNLFKLAQIREFSKEAEFHNPSQSFVLYDVMCPFCSSVSNLDLLRDIHLMENDHWKCKHCKNDYDKIAVEKRLIDILKRKSLAYQLQDFVCEKCNQVKEDNLALYCKNCSGPFVSCMSQDEMNSFISRFSKIADLHHFDWLKDIIHWMEV